MTSYATLLDDKHSPLARVIETYAVAPPPVEHKRKWVVPVIVVGAVVVVGLGVGLGVHAGNPSPDHVVTIQ